MGKNGLISRRALLGEFYRFVKLGTKAPSKITIAKAISTIEIAPTVYAEPVVRCKDCKYNPECFRHIRPTGHNPDDFCSFGARMDVEEGAEKDG